MIKNFFLFLILELLFSSCVNKNPNKSSVIVSPYFKVGKPYKINGKRYVPKHQPNYDKIAMASWYGPKFHGKLTANGDIFDQNALTAAHTTLPMPSMVKVTNLENNRSIDVVINDRGPYKSGRIIDLSKKSAQLLGFKNKGLAKVRVQYLPKESEQLIGKLTVANKLRILREKPNFSVSSSKIIAKNTKHYVKPTLHNENSLKLDYVQVGVYSSKENAGKTYRRLNEINAGIVEILSSLNNNIMIYKVVVNPFSPDGNLHEILQNVKDAGFTDAIVKKQSV